MALIKCPECGREISDKAVSCPGCGCPVATFAPVIIKGHGEEIIKLEGDKFLYYKYNKLLYTANKYDVRIKSKKEPGKISNGRAVFKVNPLLPAVDFGFYSRADYNTFFSIFSDVTEKDVKKAKEAARQAKYAQQYQPDRNAIKCPKCGSTSITYIQKPGTFFGVEIVEGVFAGGNSTKGRCKCLNCGKEWKK